MVNPSLPSRRATSPALARRLAACLVLLPGLWLAAPPSAQAGWGSRDGHGWPRASQDEDGRRRGGDRDAGGSNYAPSECRWVQIAKEALGADGSGRTVYRVTQQNSCTGKKRTFRTY